MLTGAATVCWYALPDHVRSRRARAVVRAALVAAVVASSPSTGGAVPSARSRSAAVPKTPSSPRTATPAPEDEVTVVGVLGVVGFTGAIVGAVLGAVGVTVAVDRTVHRIGDRAARADTRLPHTRVGVVLGALTALASLATEEEAPPRRGAPRHPEDLTVLSGRARAGGC